MLNRWSNFDHPRGTPRTETVPPTVDDQLAACRLDPESAAQNRYEPSEIPVTVLPVAQIVPLVLEAALEKQVEEVADIIVKNKGKVENVKGAEGKIRKVYEAVYNNQSTISRSGLAKMFEEKLKGTDYVMGVRIDPDDDDHLFVQIGTSTNLVAGSLIKFACKH